jgi:nicotinamide mononucleotide adenylyltransferase
LYENDEKSINDKIQRQASWKSQWNRTSRSVDISAVVNANVYYDTCVNNNEQNSSRRRGIMVNTDVENAWEDLDPEGVKF